MAMPAYKPLLAEAHATNRRVLAGELADVIADHGFDADTAAALPEAGWALVLSIVAHRRGRPVSTPSTATLMQAVALLRSRERVAAKAPADPFAGLPS